MDDPTDKRGMNPINARGVKVAISALWYTCAALSRGATRLAGRTPASRFIVLYYHGVPDDARAGFARQMRVLARGATVVRAAHSGPLGGGRSYVAITFDDAFRSVGANAVPELVSRGFPATIFVPVAFVGQKPGWMTLNGVNDEVMTAEELRSLPELIELGSHSLSHPHLTRIDPGRLDDEIATSRSTLAELLDSEVSLLAFPFGEYDERVVGACRQAGYERVFGIDPRPVDPVGRDFVRGRVTVEPTDSALVFFLKAHGAYGWMTHASALKRRLARLRRFQ